MIRAFLMAAAVLFSCLAAAQADTKHLDAPYQILGTAAMTGDTYVSEDDIYSDDKLLLIDFGAQQPEEKSIPQTMTIIGTKGQMQAHFLKIEKKCSYLCGISEGESCHYEAIYAQPLDADIGTPVTAFAGDIGAKDFTPVWEKRKVVDTIYVLPKKLPSKSFSLVHSPYDGYDVKIRIKSQDNVAQKVVLDLENTVIFGNKGHSIEAAECLGHTFTKNIDGLTCGSVSLLFGDGKPLLMSEPDYNAAMLRVLSSFVSGGQTYYLVRIGLKAESPVGLLFKTKDGWHFNVRKRDYPSMC